jgi:hypothetical protein
VFVDSKNWGDDRYPDEAHLVGWNSPTCNAGLVLDGLTLHYGGSTAQGEGTLILMYSTNIIRQDHDVSTFLPN